jgi:MFS transporter, UMF1 family
MKYSKKIQNAWAMYDWANSTYNLVIGTAIFPIFYNAVTTMEKNGVPVDGAPGDMVLFFGATFKNTELLSYCLAFAMAIVCMLSPTLAGVADYLGRKKIFMRFFCYLGALSCASLYFFDPQVGRLEMSMLSVILACIGFWCSYAFSNSFLPEIAPPEEQDKLSAKGYSFGYFGSVLLLLINLVMMQVFDIDVRYCFLTVGIWWIGFAHYTFWHLKEEKSERTFDRKIITHGFQELNKVWTGLRQTKRLKAYLLSFFVFSMGVQTIMQMATFFGEKEVYRIGPNGEKIIGLETGELISAVLLVQLIAIPGAFTFSYLSKRIGNTTTLKCALGLWTLVCLYGYFMISSPISFYIAAGCIGFIMGGTQSLARSTYSKFLPRTEDTASYFSFYDVIEKVGLIIGLLSFGFLEGAFGSLKASILALSLFFIVGLTLMFLVPKKESSHSTLQFES